jgi:2,3-bisphosphoglycerate-independent phosphoglycerate mutase
MSRKGKVEKRGGMVVKVEESRDVEDRRSKVLRSRAERVTDWVNFAIASSGGAMRKKRVYDYYFEVWVRKGGKGSQIKPTGPTKEEQKKEGEGEKM